MGERTGRLKLKRRIREELSADDFGQGLAAIESMPLRPAANALTLPLCDRDELTRWRSAQALGLLVSRLAENDLEAARTMVRRQMWNLNDESGCCAWGAPEAMAWMLHYNDTLAEEFAHVLVSYIVPEGSYLDYDLLRRGAVLGVWLVAGKRPGLVEHARPHLAMMLDSADAAVRGLSAMALGLLGKESDLSALEAMADDGEEFNYYVGGLAESATVGEAAAAAANNIRARSERGITPAKE